MTVNTSCYSFGIPGQGGFLVYGPVRSAGARSVVVLALLARGQRLGFLLCGDERRLLLSTAEVERLELLASQAAVALLTVSGMAELRSRATRDPLTGLGNRAASPRPWRGGARRP